MLPNPQASNLVRVSFLRYGKPCDWSQSDVGRRRVIDGSTSRHCMLITDTTVSSPFRDIYDIDAASIG